MTYRSTMFGTCGLCYQQFTAVYDKDSQSSMVKARETIEGLVKGCDHSQGVNQ
jgi:hypothetical protein